MPRRESLSKREARWLAIEAQGLGRPRPARAGAAQIRATAKRLGAIQLDAINVVERTQHLVVFSRLGRHDRTRLHAMSEPPSSLWEYWGRAASLQPVEDEPLFRWRYRIGSAYNPGPRVQARIDAWRTANAEYSNAVLAEVRDRGPLTAGQLSDPRRRTGTWWGRRSVGRQTLEDLFGRGVLGAWRLPSFERMYDLRERVLPPEVLAVPTPAVEDAQRALLLRAARAYGIATLADLAAFFGIPLAAARARVAELVDAGDVVQVVVDGWSEAAYCLPRARPRPPTRTTGTLLSPFDSLIWDRRRALRLFGFDYRIEVYVPAPKRVHGYYVLPFLLGNALVARVDLKADRKASTLRVLATHFEPGADVRGVTSALRAELDSMRDWLGLDSTR